MGSGQSFQHPRTPRRQERKSSALAMRILMLDGENGSVGCRVYGPLGTSTLPKLSENNVVESATRSWLRMRNLVAVRGVPGGESMIGPADYFGNLEMPHRYRYTISFQSWNPIPEFRRIDWDPQQSAEWKHNEDEKSQHELSDRHVVRVRGQWKSHVKKKTKHENEEEEQSFGPSLFPRPGLFLLEQKEILLPYFDASWKKLERFRARIVRNDVPFSITQRPLPVADEYRLVTYVYGPGYADRQIKRGGGLFLETHAFAQFITPMSLLCSGYVILATAISGRVHEYDMIAVHIPYGWTLIIDPGCIHGDTTLVGHFLMGMTSNHRTMATADTVFLKYHNSDRETCNVYTQILYSEDLAARVADAGDAAPNANAVVVSPPRVPPRVNRQIPCQPPYVLFYNGGEKELEEFHAATQRTSFIVNPTSAGYWYSFT
jgi:hypothetical protein